MSKREHLSLTIWPLWTLARSLRKMGFNTERKGLGSLYVFKGEVTIGIDGYAAVFAGDIYVVSKSLAGWPGSELTLFLIRGNKHYYEPFDYITDVILFQDADMLLHRTSVDDVLGYIMAHDLLDA